MSTSLQDIADALKLSKTTVSWILSGKGMERGFSLATIKRVTDYAERINYHPNLLARSLSTGTTNTLGLIIPYISDTFYSQLAQAIEEEAKKHNYVITICSSEGDSRHEIELINMLESKRVDGLIIAPTKDSEKEIARLSDKGTPFVLIDRFFPELDTNYVIVDNENGSYELVSHLIDKGARNIALVASDSHLYVMGKRIEGYRKALLNHGLPIDPGMILEVDRVDYESDIIRSLDALLRYNPETDAFFFATHYLAFESLRYFIARKIDYRNKFQLGCFHETQGLDILAPEMAISRMPIDQIGFSAVNTLLNQIQRKLTETSRIMLGNRLQV